MSRRNDESRDRLSDVFLDEDTIPRGKIEDDHERAVAIFDLVEENSFAVPGRDDGPYTMTISQEESKFTFDVRTSDGEQAVSIVVSMTPFRSLLKDYFLVCETYYSAIRTASPRQIEAIDRERTKLHNEGAELMAPAPHREGDDRPGHRAAPLHPHLDAALEDMSSCERSARKGRAASRPSFSPTPGSSPRRSCPELRLWLADEAVPIWKKTEEELGEMGLPPPFWAFAWAGGQALARYVLDNPDPRSRQARARFRLAARGSSRIAAALAGAAAGRGLRHRPLRRRRDRGQRRREPRRRRRRAART